MFIFAPEKKGWLEDVCLSFGEPVIFQGETGNCYISVGYTKLFSSSTNQGQEQKIQYSTLPKTNSSPPKTSKRVKVQDEMDAEATTQKEPKPVP